MKKINWRYALGELLIVVIGITIAFALNNWAGAIKDKNEEKAYIQNIKNDLEHDIAGLDSNIIILKNRMGSLKSMFPHLRAKIPGRDTIAMKVFQVADPVSFQSMQTTIQSMKFSGDLKLISDLNLKNAIIEHYNVYDNVDIQNERHANFSRDYLAEYFMKNIDYSQFNSDAGFDFLDDTYFHNLVYGLYGIYGIELKAQMKALQSARNLHTKL